MWCGENWGTNEVQRMIFPPHLKGNLSCVRDSAASQSQWIISIEKKLMPQSLPVVEHNGQPSEDDLTHPVTGSHPRHRLTPVTPYHKFSKRHSDQQHQSLGNTDQWPPGTTTRNNQLFTRLTRTTVASVFVEWERLDSREWDSVTWDFGVVKRNQPGSRAPVWQLWLVVWFTGLFAVSVSGSPMSSVDMSEWEWVHHGWMTLWPMTDACEPMTTDNEWPANHRGAGGSNRATRALRESINIIETFSLSNTLWLLELHWVSSVRNHIFWSYFTVGSDLNRSRLSVIFCDANETRALMM